MAADSNDQQIASEMSQRLGRLGINDQECYAAYEPSPIDSFLSSEPTYAPGYQLDPPGEVNAKSGFYILSSMHENVMFDPTLPIQDTTDIGSEGSSVYPGQSQETSVNGMDWTLVDAGFTHMSTPNGIDDNTADSFLAIQSTFPQNPGSYAACLSNDRMEQFSPADSQNIALEQFACPHGCPKPFRRLYDLKRHIKEQHLCPLQGCGGKLFPTPTDRKRHLQRDHHENDLLYKCGSCGLKGQSYRAFTRMEKLRKHFKDLHKVTASQWNAFQCKEDPCYVEEFCGGTWFLSKDQLNEHLRSEHTERFSEGFQPTGPNTSEHTSRAEASKCMTGLTPQASTNSRVSAAAHIPSPLQSSSSAGIVAKRLLGKAPQSDPKRCKSDDVDLASPVLHLNALQQSGLRTESLASSSNAVENQAKANGASVLIHSVPSIDPALTITKLLEVTHSISVRELHALVNCDEFNHIVEELESFHISPVFDTSKEAIKLRGTCSTMDMEKGDKLLKSLIDEVKLGDPPKRKAEVSIRKMLRKKFSQQVFPAAPVKISALDPVEDEEALITWANFILPQLPKAVDDLPVGEKYSAALVRQESSDGTPIPIIRFRSSNGQSEATRMAIRTNIENLCKQNDRPVIPVQFSQGITVPLVGGNRKRSEDCVVADDDPPNDQKRFAHQRRFWQKVGMGASIGMRECCHISATSGGYILINGRKYMLSVDHFIQEAVECETCEVSTKLNSPSPCDVYDQRQDLDNKLNELELKARHSALQEEIPLDKVHEMLLPEKISEELDLYNRFRQELLKDPKEFELGDVVCRCVQDSIRDSILAQPTASGMPKHRMDWSISEIREQREGKNVHRHARVTEPGIEDFKREILKPEGAGEPCEETGDPQGGDAVHYVGQTNGLRYGIVNPTLMLIKDADGRVSQEWTIVLSDSFGESSECFEGDSGAWIIRNDNKLMGLLWGWDNYLLLFTPVRDVFADIERVFSGAKNIRLPPHSRSSRAMLQATTKRINRKHNSRSRALASGYVGSRLEEQLLSTRQARAKPHLLVTDGLGSNTQTEVSAATANDQISSPPLSPVPSLVSSAASCCSSESFSPRPRLPSEPPIIESDVLSSIRQAGNLEELQQIELTQYPKFGMILKRSFSFEHVKKIGQQGLVKHFPTWPCSEEFGHSRALVAM